TITGSLFQGNFASGSGGAIYHTVGNLKIDGTSFLTSTAFRSGAIYAEGTITISKTKFSQNANYDDGGPHVITAKGTITITESEFTNNISQRGAGMAKLTGNILISDTKTANNDYGLEIDGTALLQRVSLGVVPFNNIDATTLMTSGSVQLIDSTVSGGTDFGGTLRNSGDLVVERTAFSGLAVFSAPIANSGTMHFISSLVSQSIGGFAVIVNNDNAVMTITNSTISGNTANNGGSDDSVISNGNNGTLTIANSTITGNEASSAITGDGILLNNSIVAGNVADFSGTPTTEIDGTLNPSSSNNVVGDPASAGGLTHGKNGNIIGVGGAGRLDIHTVLITTLGNNGGPTRTHALIPGSPAINAGSNALAVDFAKIPLAFDQRGMGFARIQNSTVDIGAFESNLTPPSTLTLTLDRTSVLEGSLPHIVATVSRSGSTASSLAVTIMSDSTEVSFPPTITIPAGKASTTFELQGVDDGIVDGTQTVIATVSASGFTSDSQSFTVIDTDATNGEGVLIFDDVSRTWRLGVPNGTGLNWFQTNPLPAATNGWQGFVGDFNGDGLLDGMALNMSNLRFNFYRNTGEGTLANPVPAGALSTNFTWDNFMVGDYDGNGRAEVMAQIVSTGLGQGAMRSQDSSGVSRFYVTLNTGYEELITGDFNGDGIDDVVGLFDNVTQTRSNIIPAISISTPVGRRFTSILGSGQFGQSVATGGLHNLTVGDWNGDGRDDIAVQNTNGQIFTATTIGDARINAPGAQNFVVSARSPRLDPATYSNLFVAGNFTNDAREDLMVLRDTNQLIAAISNVNTNSGDAIPDGSVEQHLEIWAEGVSNGEDIIVGDFNGDGLDDVVALGTTGVMSLSGGSEFSVGLNFGNVIGGAIGNINGAGAGRVI
ncbi:MAG: VCBS repeat-containing protein, partial [Planctomycetaceae bacterium]|nr:VCBS repeat-containing protein [Planctomycetaceae bacterium]